MTASITISNAPDVRYLLRIADTCLILAQRYYCFAHCALLPQLRLDLT